jgi:hypothetical protein
MTDAEDGTEVGILSRPVGSNGDGVRGHGVPVRTRSRDSNHCDANQGGVLPGHPSRSNGHCGAQERVVAGSVLI